MQTIKTLAAATIATLVTVSTAHAIDLNFVRKLAVVPHVVTAVVVDGGIKAAEDGVNAGLQTLLSR